MMRYAAAPNAHRPVRWKAALLGWRQTAIMPSGWLCWCRDVTNRWHPHIGALGNCAGLSERHHPPRIGGQGQETVGARCLTPTQRAARSIACRAAHRPLRVPTSLHRQFPPIRKFGPAATARPPAVALAALRAAREVTQIMLKIRLPNL